MTDLPANSSDPVLRLFDAKATTWFLRYAAAARLAQLVAAVEQGVSPGAHLLDIGCRNGEDSRNTDRTSASSHPNLVSSSSSFMGQAASIDTAWSSTSNGRREGATAAALTPRSSMTQLQRDYYTETAAAYNSVHLQPGDEHFVALEYATELLGVVRAKSVLDVGSGTGRAVRFLQQRRPDLQVEGVGPVAELREQARFLGVALRDGSGEELPFDDGSFDVVISFGLLHHVPDPEQVIAEMTRVARCGVMISDTNRFAQGSIASCVLKLGIHSMHLWPTFERIRTKGRGYMQSNGDGVFYSYSIFDSTSQLQYWGDKVFIVPTAPQKRISVPQLATPHGLVDRVPRAVRARLGRMLVKGPRPPKETERSGFSSWGAFGITVFTWPYPPPTQEEGRPVAYMVLSSSFPSSDSA